MKTEKIEPGPLIDEMTIRLTPTLIDFHLTEVTVKVRYGEEIFTFTRILPPDHLKTTIDRMFWVASQTIKEKINGE